MILWSSSADVVLKEGAEEKGKEREREGGREEERKREGERGEEEGGKAT